MIINEKFSVDYVLGSTAIDPPRGFLLNFDYSSPMVADYRLLTIDYCLLFLDELPEQATACRGYATFDLRVADAVLFGQHPTHLRYFAA